MSKTPSEEISDVLGFRKIDAANSAMKTATELKREFDKSTTGGLQCLKAMIKEKNELVKIKEAHATEMEAKLQKRQSEYAFAVQSQQTMKQQMMDNEERLGQIQRKQTELKKRLDEKIEMLRETQGYTADPSIELADQAEAKLKALVAKFNDNSAKFNAAREKKQDLEQKKSMLECKTRGAETKLSYLRTEFHHATLKQERLKQEKAQLEALRSATSSQVKTLENGIETDTRKVDAAKIRVNSLQASIESKEDEIVSMTLNRKKLEGTIINILTKIKEQHEKNRYLDVAYTLNKDSFVA